MDQIRRTRRGFALVFQIRKEPLTVPRRGQDLIKFRFWQRQGD